MTRRALLGRAAAGGALAWTLPAIASADPVAAAAGSACTPVQTRNWHAFPVGLPGTVAVTQKRNFGPNGGFLDVTDAYLTGDRFEIFHEGQSCGTTSAAANLGPGVWTNDPDVAFADARWSSGRFWFPPFNQTFTIVVLASPWSGGGGFWRDGRC